MSETVKKCPYCGSSLYDGDVFCDQCGRELPDQEHEEEIDFNVIMCKHCGMQIPKDSKFCKHCGHAVDEEPQQNTNKLMYCPSCGKEVNQEAYQCPHCGHPFKEPKNNGEQTVVHTQSGLSFWGVVGAIIVAILICSFC